MDGRGPELPENFVSSCFFTITEREAQSSTKPDEINGVKFEKQLSTFVLIKHKTCNCKASDQSFNCKKAKWRVVHLV